MQKEKKFDIISFYKFIILDDLEKHQLAIKKFLIDKDLKGTLILSPEGLNGTVSGVEGFVKKFNQFLFKNFSFDSLMTQAIYQALVIFHLTNLGLK